MTFLDVDVASMCYQGIVRRSWWCNSTLCLISNSRVEGCLHIAGVGTANLLAPAGAEFSACRTDALQEFVVANRCRSISTFVASDKAYFQNRPCPARNARHSARRAPTSRPQHSDYSLLCGGLL